MLTISLIAVTTFTSIVYSHANVSISTPFVPRHVLHNHNHNDQHSVSKNHNINISNNSHINIAGTRSDDSHMKILITNPLELLISTRGGAASQYGDDADDGYNYDSEYDDQYDDEYSTSNDPHQQEEYQRQRQHQRQRPPPTITNRRRPPPTRRTTPPQPKNYNANHHHHHHHYKQQQQQQQVHHPRGARGRPNRNHDNTSSRPQQKQHFEFKSV